MLNYQRVVDVCNWAIGKCYEEQHTASSWKKSCNPMMDRFICRTYADSFVFAVERMGWRSGKQNITEWGGNYCVDPRPSKEPHVSTSLFQSFFFSSSNITLTVVWPKILPESRSERPNHLKVTPQWLCKNQHLQFNICRATQSAAIL